MAMSRIYARNPGIAGRATPNPHHPFTLLWLSFIIIFTRISSERTGTPLKEIKREEEKNPFAGLELIVPPTHTALGGDVHVQVIGSPLPAHLWLEILRPAPLSLITSTNQADLQPLERVMVLTDARQTNLTTILIRCGVFSHGGRHILRLTLDDSNQNEVHNQNVSSVSGESLVSRILDVRWPTPKLALIPEHVQTYPENPVTAVLEFPEVICPPVAEKVPLAIPEFWLELHFCGPSLVTCDSSHRGNLSTQVLYSEQVRGFPGKRVVLLRCELFGLAGHYALVLRPTTQLPSVTSTAVYLKADWSEQFVFNVHARSIFPCDSLGGGVPVLFQYPGCILQSGDRIRLYAKLRADVASLAPPTSLEYVGEQRFVRGQHALHFDCDLFVEKYVEYCFVYVSQAITGAVADVRMDCVPTLPVSESESGGWGNWSEWTPCTTTCAGGTRNRHRFCDSPPPRYGAKFCEGPAVETMSCGSGEGASDWECMYGGGESLNGDVPADRPEVRAEIGPGCRCGCVVHLGHTKPRRLVATSSQSCPGRTFWLIQADEGHSIKFKVEHIRLPCGNQWLKVRDGSSLSAKLLAQLVGTPFKPPADIISTGSMLLLEFFSDELMAAGEVCGGGFFAYVQQISTIPAWHSSGDKAAVQGAILMSPGSNTTVRLTLVHIVALIFVFVVIVVSAALIVQYLFRYRKYQLADDMDSFEDVSGGSGINLTTPIRAGSNATLLSEVISLTRLRPRIKSNKHSRLRESVDCEAVLASEEIDEDSETQVEDDSSVGSTLTLQQQKHVTTALITNAKMVEDEKDVTSPTDTSTTASTSAPSSPKCSPLRRSSTFSPNAEQIKKPQRSQFQSGHASPVREEQGDASPRQFSVVRRFSNVSNVTLTHGCYSPALSTISRATIRTTANPKESKEKRNRERLLAGPGSEFSLAGPDTDLELDYYDYNVVNAGAAPGSYLGMDPAFLVWIPPLGDSGEAINEAGEHDYADIRPRQYIDPGSNTESPESEKLTPTLVGDKKPEIIDQSKIVPILISKKRGEKILLAPEIIAVEDGPLKVNDYKANRKNVPSFCEKETRVEKSPSSEFSEIDSIDSTSEIRFVDDDDDDVDVVTDSSGTLDIRGNKLKESETYHSDSNILATKNK